MTRFRESHVLLCLSHELPPFACKTCSTTTTVTEATREKLSLAGQGHLHSEALKAKIGAPQRDRVCSAETKAKIAWSPRARHARQRDMKDGIEGQST